MITSLSVFQEHLIDYAGLFPPANLSLEEAINNYAKYKKSEESWMLGPFVLPVSKLKQVETYIHLFSNETPLALSIVGGRSSTAAECKNQLQEEIKQISAFIEQYKNRVKVDLLEIPLPSYVPGPDLLKEIENGAAKLKVHAFCEVPLTGDWKKHVSAALDAIAAHNASADSWIGVKLRTGGIKAELFPSPEQVAFVLDLCRNRGLPIKFTAGLHHPIRMYRDEVNTHMHGFLNIFLAGILAYTQKLSAKRIEEILSDENASSFSFGKDELAWRDISVASQEIQMIRQKSILSFGSCSFDEPKDELRELINHQGVIL